MSDKGYGRGGWRQRIGGPAYCVCPKYGYRVPHARGAHLFPSDALNAEQP